MKIIVYIAQERAASEKPLPLGSGKFKKGLETLSVNIDAPGGSDMFNKPAFILNIRAISINKEQLSYVNTWHMLGLRLTESCI